MVVLAWLVAVSFVASAANAQETRGTIAGTVADDQAGSVPGVAVTIINLDTNASTRLVTNDSGYYEASLLLPGNYQVTAALAGFKTAVRTGLVLSVGQRLGLNLSLEVGALTESVSVTGEAPLIDASSVTTGQNFDRRKVDSLPMFANMPVLLTRYVAGVNSSGAVPYVAQGYVNRTSQDTSSPGGVGGNEWTIDGAPNNGSNRRLASSPNSDMIQEMRVETANFDASFGHGTGLGISMMTRAGTNTPHGTANYQHWNARFNSPNYFQRDVFSRNPAQKAAYNAGNSHNLATTFGGPIVIPGIVNGRDRLFAFVNYSYDDTFRAGQTGGSNTVPTLANLRGDFSNLLAVDPVRYQIYDPLTVRADPARPGHFIRDPFPGNIIPQHRIVNPMYGRYASMLPAPNNDPTDLRLEPSNNYLSAGEPDPIGSQIYGARVDYNHSSTQRFFFRYSGSYFTEGLGDWTYESMPGLHSRDTLRTANAGTANWTLVKSSTTVIDSQFSANRYHEGDRWLLAGSYKPSDVGLPTALDQQCTALNACSLPVVQVSGYQTIGSTNPNWFHETTNVQGSINITNVRGQHTFRTGVDIRQHYRTGLDPGPAAGQLVFDNTYTRRNDDTAVAPAGQLGLGWAAFMLGIPTVANAASNTDYSTHSPYYGFYVQDAWRASRSLTINLGLRFEYENGITEARDRMIAGFDPTLRLAITDRARAAYAARPVSELPASEFEVLGGAVYPATSPLGRRAWPGQAMWLPRVSAAWAPSERLVFKAGYGLYFDTLNATALTIDQLGYSNVTSVPASNDFGQTWNMGDPRAGVPAVTNPFPAGFETAYGDSLGADVVSGANYSYSNLNRERARMQRWRASVQRELGANTAIEVAYVGSFADRVDVSVRQDVLPEQYWNQTNVRNNAIVSNLNANVTNPFYIANFEDLRTSDPRLYARLASQAIFASPTIQKHNLLRDYPHINGLTALYQPLGKVRTHAIEASLQRRFSKGVSANFSYTGMRAEEWTTIVNEYEKAPTQWLTSQSARPHRVTANAIYELPFGRSRAFLTSGLAAAVLGGWQVSSTFEYQPGALLQFPNVFFYGDVAAIKEGESTLERWFNTDAGFERDAAKAPAQYQARAFPLRIDGLRADKTLLVNANLQRTFTVAGRTTLQVRVDAANLLDRDHFAAPNLTPTSTLFGRVTSATSTANRFFTFVGKLQF